MSDRNYFPEQIRSPAAFADEFEAYEVEAGDCRVLYGRYPVGTITEPHSHNTDNIDVICR